MTRPAASPLLAALLPLLLAACDPAMTPPTVEIPKVCEDQVYADPVVKDLIMKGAGTENFRINHENQLQAAKQDAANRCMRNKGMMRPGGVERRRVTG